MRKRIISLVLTFCMVLTLMPSAVFATETVSETTTVTIVSTTDSTTVTTAAVTTTVATAPAEVTSKTDAQTAQTTAQTTEQTSVQTSATTVAEEAKPVVSPTDSTTTTTVSSVFITTTTAKPQPGILNPKITSATDVDAIEKAQLLINSLPDEVTESNLATVEAHLDAIDEAMSKLTDGERAALNLDKYNAAIAAVNALYGMSGADVPTTADDTSVLQSMLNSDGTIKLNKDTVVNATLVVAKNITFDLNGHVLEMTGTGSVFDVSGGGSLTITDSNPTNAHSGSYASLPVGGVITGGTGTLVSQHTYGGGVYIRKGTLTMNGGTIYNCTADYGGGVYINKYREFEMTGGTIKGCTATMGDGVYVSGTFKANGGEIGSTVHISETGTIECTSSSACTVFNDTVTAWKSSINGGVFFGSIVTGGGATTGVKHTITFDLNGGSGKTTEIVIGTNVKAVKPADPTKTDCIFMGWYKDDVEYDFNEVLTSDITLKARWLGSEVSSEDELRAAINGGITSIKLTSDITLAKTFEYSDREITLDLNGHVITGKIKLVDNPASPGTTLTLIDSDPTATHSDSTLPKGGVVNGVVELTRNTNGTECSLYANGGTVMGKVPMTWVSRIYCTSNTPTAFMSTTEGTGGVHGGIFYGGIIETYIKEKTVTFMNNDSRYAVEVVKSGNKAVAPITPTSSDSHFVGWYAEGATTPYDFGTTVMENIVLTAKWQKYELKVSGENLVYGTDYTYEGDVLTVLSSKEMTIENTDKTTATAHRIVVAKDVSANITLAGVNIDTSSISEAAFSVENGSTGNVTVTLKADSENTLKSGSKHAGLEKSGNGDSIGKLTVGGSGSLTAIGGDGGAGIGGGKSCCGANILISGGKITATGAGGGAGIGGGHKSSGYDITISGGEVTATGGSGGAGIGGGNNGGDGGYNITISGGKVTATGTSGGAGIGGGNHGDGHDIRAKNAVVKATGGYNAAGIGGGVCGDAREITVENATVTATGGQYGAGIGGGGVCGSHSESGKCDTVFIVGSSVKATATKDSSGKGGADIGTGYGNSGATVGKPMDDDGKEVYLVTIANENGEKVYIDGVEYTPSNHGALNETNLYAYLPGKHHTVKVGDKESCYHFDTSFVLCVLSEDYDSDSADHWQLCSDSDCTVKHNKEAHDFDWNYNTESYWEECTVCGYKKSAKPLPNVELSCSDVVCKTQDLKITVTIPNVVKFESLDYKSGNDIATLSTSAIGGVCTVTVGAADYKASSFTVCVNATTSDGCTFTVKKAVRVQDAHSGGTADCCHKALCEVCGEEYGEVNGKNHTDLQHVEKKAATAKNEGNIEYWYCADCGKYYSDKELTTEITQAQTVIARLDNTAPKTGEKSVAPYVVILLISAAVIVALVVYERRRKLQGEKNGK